MNEIVSQPQSRAVAVSEGIGISGLEEFDVKTLPVPFVRLVQPTSRNVKLEGGKKEAPVGSYYFGDTMEAVQPLDCVILKAKHGEKTFKDISTGKPKLTKMLSILAYSLEMEKMFLLQLSVMSFNGFGKFVAQLKKMKAGSTWDFNASFDSDLVENDKGKFYIAQVSIGKKLSDDQKQAMAEMSYQYGEVVNKSFDEDMEEATVVQATPRDQQPTEDNYPEPSEEEMNRPQDHDVSEDIPF